jgi:hypothetical protein
MSELAREMERQSRKESFMSGRTCPDCDETIREAKLIQTSLLPTHGFRNESVDIAFRFRPFSDVGATLSTSSVYRTVSSESTSGTWSGKLVGSHVCRARDGNPARDSRVRNGYRAGSFPVERASGAATHQGPLLLHLVRSFQPVTRGNSSSPTPECHYPCWSPEARAGNLARVGYPRECSRVPLTDGTSCSLSQEIAFCLRPTVFMNCTTGRESNSAPPTWRRLGHNAGTNPQPNRRTSFSTVRWPSPMAACRTMILAW